MSKPRHALTVSRLLFILHRIPGGLRERGDIRHLEIRCSAKKCALGYFKGDKGKGGEGGGGTNLRVKGVQWRHMCVEGIAEVNECR